MSASILPSILGEWPWWVAGPVIGLFVPALLLLGNKDFGISSNLRHLCAILAPGRVAFFRYDWRGQGLWNLLFLAGVVLGGFLSAHFGSHQIALSQGAHYTQAAWGIHDFTGLAPQEVFAWSSLLTLRGFLSIIVGGFLVGFGIADAGGCTSGHAITGLANFQLPSLIAVIGFFAGGLLASWFILPLLIGGLR